MMVMVMVTMIKFLMAKQVHLVYRWMPFLFCIFFYTLFCLFSVMFLQSLLH